MLYPYGYEQYLESLKKPIDIAPLEVKPVKEKKTYTTPAKEKAKKERAIKKAEEKIALLEEKLAGVESELQLDENMSDYLKLSELQTEQEELQTELDIAMNEWEQLSEELANLI